MSNQGCLAALFIAILVAWSLVVGGIVTAGWLGAAVIEFLVAVVLADAQAARRAADGLVQTLRSLGFGVLAVIWTIGAAVIALMWFAIARGSQRVRTIVVAGEAHEIRLDATTRPAEMKDVTPPRDRLPPPSRRDPA